jgi:hypothetical protein
VSLDDWQALAIVSGSLLTTLTLVGVLYRWVAKPVFNTIRRLNQVADQLLGDRTKKIPSMTERMAAIEEGLEEHLRWHRVANRQNGPTAAKPSVVREEV